MWSRLLPVAAAVLAVLGTFAVLVGLISFVVNQLTGQMSDLVDQVGQRLPQPVAEVGQLGAQPAQPRPAEVESEVRRMCGEPVRLHESYRSSPRVLETVNSISEKVEPGSGLVSAWPEEWPGGGCSAALVLQDQAEEAALALVPFLGAAAQYLFAIGLLSVSILAAGVLHKGPFEELTDEQVAGAVAGEDFRIEQSLGRQRGQVLDPFLPGLLLPQGRL